MTSTTSHQSSSLSTSMDQLDREHKLTGFYRKLDADAKNRAKLAFASYEAAVASGDAQLAAAARERFLQATAVLAQARKGER